MCSPCSWKPAWPFSWRTDRDHVTTSFLCPAFFLPPVLSLLGRCLYIRVWYDAWYKYTVDNAADGKGSYHKLCSSPGIPGRVWFVFGGQLVCRFYRRLSTVLGPRYADINVECALADRLEMMCLERWPAFFDAIFEYLSCSLALRSPSGSSLLPHRAPRPPRPRLCKRRHRLRSCHVLSGLSSCRRFFLERAIFFSCI